MSLFFRGQERRSWVDVPAIPTNGERGWIGPARTVNLSSTESGMQKIAVAASVNLLCSVASMLPVKVFTGSGGAARQIATPKWMLDLGGQGHGTDDWVWQLIYSWGLRGNVYGVTGDDRDPLTGRPRTIVLQHPDDVSVHRDSDTGDPIWHVNGRQVDTAKIWHRRIFPVPGAIRGASPIARHALTVGLGLASEQFGAQFFTDGGHPTAMLRNTAKTIDQPTATKIKERVMATLGRRREPLVLGNDWEWKPIQVAPNESQFLETNRYSNAECARIFGPGMPEMLGYETGGSMTYANVEQRALDLLTFTLDPWLVRIERVLTELLPAPQYAKLERKALVRTDLLTRFKAHEIALRNEFEFVNEVRAVEDLPPVEWGDERPTAKTAPPVPVQMEAL